MYSIIQKLEHMNCSITDIYMKPRQSCDHAVTRQTPKTPFHLKIQFRKQLSYLHIILQLYYVNTLLSFCIVVCKMFHHIYSVILT